MHQHQRVTRARLASAARIAKSTQNPADEARVDELRGEYRTEAAEAYITRVVAAAPPLTAAQRNRLALLLRGGDAA